MGPAFFFARGGSAPFADARAVWYSLGFTPIQGGIMGKGKDAKKETKKPATKSLKEKRAEKAEKKKK